MSWSSQQICSAPLPPASAYYPARRDISVLAVPQNLHAVDEYLAEMGHKVRRGVGVYGGYQGIWREEEPRRYFGGTDPRKDGCAVGY